MTELEGAGVVMEFTLGDRLRKARDRTGLTAKAFAALIGVSEKTVNNAEGDKRAVRPITLNAWAAATGVSREWLATGQAPHHPSPPGQAIGPATQLEQLRDEKLRKKGRDFDISDGAPDTHRYADPLQPTG